ncbi:MAG: DinB family protein [Ginsengibacter sp.]
MENRKEVWQRGSIEDIPSLLQPVAHALLEAGEEAHIIMEGFPENLLWERPAGLASPAFHLQHIRGVIDRLFTYSRKELLSEQQMIEISQEGNKEKTSLSAQQMIDQLDLRIDEAVEELKNVNTDSLTELRGIGRKQIPTTLIGLYVHAAEHSMRHIGQLLVTVRVLKELKKS